MKNSKEPYPNIWTYVSKGLLNTTHYTLQWTYTADVGIKYTDVLKMNFKTKYDARLIIIAKSQASYF